MPIDWSSYLRDVRKRREEVEPYFTAKPPSPFDNLDPQDEDNPVAKWLRNVGERLRGRFEERTGRLRQVGEKIGELGRSLPTYESPISQAYREKTLLPEGAQRFAEEKLQPLSEKFGEATMYLPLTSTPAMVGAIAKFGGQIPKKKLPKAGLPETPKVPTPEVPPVAEGAKGVAKEPISEFAQKYGREPWQMTKQEIHDKAKELLTPGAEGKPFTAERTILLNKQVAYHKELVQKALSEGKPVPESVLSDYPDLAKAVPEAPIKQKKAMQWVEDEGISDLSGNPIAVDKDGLVTLYHRTTKENADQISKTGNFFSKENANETFFSSKPTGQAKGYGDTIVTVKVPAQNIRIDDAFSDEIHVAISNKVLSKRNLISTKQPAKPVAPKAEVPPIPPEKPAAMGAGEIPPTKPPETAVGAMPGPEVPKPKLTKVAEPAEFAGNIRLQKYPEEIRGMIQDWAEKNPELVQEARRGVRPDAQVLADAKVLVEEAGGDFERLQKRWKPGEAWNAEEILALRGTLRAKSEEALSIQKAIQAGDKSDATRIKFMTALQEQSAIQKTVSGVTAEAGRALRSFRQEAFDAIKSNDSAKMEELLKKLGGREYVDKLGEKLSLLDLNDPIAVNDFIRNAYRPKVMDWITAIFYNSILSGPKTHIINSLTNAINAITSPVERAVSAAVEVPLAKISGRSRARFFGEVKPDVLGAVAGFPEGVRGFLHTIRHGVSPEQALKWEMPYGALPGKAGRVITTPTAFLTAEDNLFSLVNQRQALYAGAYRMASREGLKGEALVKRMADLIQTPPVDLLQDAGRISEYRLFRQPAGKFAEKIIGLREAEIAGVKPLRFVIPFVRTPVNLLKYGLERSPLGIANPKLWKNLMSKNPEAADQLGRWVIGSATAGAIAYYVGQDKITGAAPTNVAERESFYREGKQPYSIRIGDTWVSYQRLEPFNQTFTQVSAVVDAIKSKEKGIEDKVMQVINTMGRNLVSQTYLSSLSDAIDAIADPERYGANFLSNFVTGLTVPASSLSRTIAQGFDPVIRQPRNLLERVMTNVPGVSKQVPARTTVLGEPTTRQTPSWSPVSINRPQVSNLNSELARLDVDIGFVGNSISNIKLTDDERKQYQVLAGELTKRRLAELIGTSGYSSQTDVGKTIAIEKMIAQAREEARGYMLSQGGVTIPHPGDEPELTKKRQEVAERAVKTTTSRVSLARPSTISIGGTRRTTTRPSPLAGVRARKLQVRTSRRTTRPSPLRR